MNDAERNAKLTCWLCGSELKEQIEPLPGGLMENYTVKCKCGYQVEGRRAVGGRGD